MRFLLVRFLLFVFLFTSAANAFAADLEFTADTTLSLTGVTFTTLTVVSGSKATSLTVGTTTFTVTVASGDTFTVNASSDITFSNDGGVSTTCGATSSIAITGPVTSVVVTPTNTVCPRRRSNATLIAPPPSAPTRVQGNATTVSVTLTWVDPIAENFAVVSIFRNQGGVFPISGTVYAEVAKGTQQYIDRNVVSGETYKYLIRARDSSGNSDGNNTEIIVNVPQKPQPVEEKKEKAEEKKEEAKPEEPKKEKVNKEEEKQGEEKIQETKKEEIKEEVQAIVTADITTIARAAKKTLIR